MTLVIKNWPGQAGHDGGLSDGPQRWNLCLCDPLLLSAGVTSKWSLTSVSQKCRAVTLIPRRETKVHLASKLSQRVASQRVDADGAGSRRGVAHGAGTEGLRPEASWERPSALQPPSVNPE